MKYQDLFDGLTSRGISPSEILDGSRLDEELTRDEALTGERVRPIALVSPRTSDDVVRIVQFAQENTIAITARGSGTGMCGGCVASSDSIILSFSKMNEIVEIDTENQTATVQPGVTLHQLDEALEPFGLVYPIFPGELSASIGGNVATNAGGMRAIKYGVTRNQVLGLEVVLANGTKLKTGGKFVKCSSGYDLTQLVIGSEGTLGLVTEIIVKLYPRPKFTATVLAPFETLDQITNAVPKIVSSGADPLILEYIDAIAIVATTQNVGLDLGIAQEIQDKALAYLLIVIEGDNESRIDEDIEGLAALVDELGAMDIYILPPSTSAKLIDAREKAFWVAKAHGANDILDIVVPRSKLPEYMNSVSSIAQATQSWIAGCGHVGDGNVHLSIFQNDSDRLHQAMEQVLSCGIALGGAVSAEHGIGREKRAYFLELEDPNKIELMRSIKTAFDPKGLLNPGAIF